MSALVTEPEVSDRAWVYVYPRPKRMGWPNLKRTGLSKNDGTEVRPAKNISPRRIRVAVRQKGGGTPEVTRISVDGFWAGTKSGVVNKQVLHQAREGLGLVVYAPDWVLELAQDAVRRSIMDLHGEPA